MLKLLKNVIFVTFLSLFFINNVNAESLNYCSTNNYNTFGYLYCGNLLDPNDSSFKENYYVVHYQIDGNSNNYYGIYHDDDNSNNRYGYLYWEDFSPGMCPSSCTINEINDSSYVGSLSSFKCEGVSVPIEKEQLKSSYVFFKNDSGDVFSLSYLPSGTYQIYKNGSFFKSSVLNTYFLNLFTNSFHVKEYWKLGEFEKIYYYDLQTHTIIDYLLNIIGREPTEFYSPFNDIKYSPNSSPDSEYDVIFNSDSKLNVLYESVDEWADSLNDMNGSISAISNFENKYSNLLNQCTIVNEAVKKNEKYSITYDMDLLVSDFKNSISDMDNILSKYGISDDEDFVLSAYNYSMTKLLGNGYKIGIGPDRLIKCDIQNYLYEKGIGNVPGTIKGYLSDIATCSVNIKNNLTSIGEQDKNDEFQEIKDSLKDILERYEVSVIIDCEGLLGEELREKLNFYMTIVRILIPIVVIALGAVDFASAVLASDEDKMKKAQARFIKRLIIGVAIFFVPTIINIILDIFNSVWTNINNDTCGF